MWLYAVEMVLMEVNGTEIWLMLANTRANDLSGPSLCLVAISGYGLGLGDKAHNGREGWS